MKSIQAMISQPLFKNICRTVSLLALLLVCCPAVDAETGQDNRPLSVIADQVITVGDFQKRVERAGSRIATPEQAEELLDGMVRFEVLYAAALQAGYDRDPRIISSFRQMMVNKLRQERLEPRLAELRVSEQEIEAYYQQHTDNFTQPERVRVAIIQISMPGRVSDEFRARLAERAAEARGEALKLTAETLSFGSVAVTYSDDQQTRYRGGDMGWLSKSATGDQWEPGVMDALFQLSEPGQVSPVIATENGFYLVKLMEVRKSRRMAPEEVRERIRHALLNDKRSQAEDQFYAELAKDIGVKTNREVLKTIELPTRPGRAGPPPLPAQ